MKIFCNEHEWKFIRALLKKNGFFHANETETKMWFSTYHHVFDKKEFPDQSLWIEIFEKDHCTNTQIPISSNQNQKRGLSMSQQPFDEDEEKINRTYESDRFRDKIFLVAGFGLILMIALLLALGIVSCTVNQNMTLSDGDRSGNLKDTTETTADPTTELKYQ